MCPRSCCLRFSRPTLLLFLLFLAFESKSSAQAAAAQTSSTDSSSLQGLILPSPIKTGILGSKTPQALSEITALIQAASLGTLKDLQATGTMTFPGGDTHPASLCLSGSGYTRLDITMASGTRSVRLRGPSGVYQSETGSRGFLPPATAMAGVLALPRIWADAVAGARISLFDGGTYPVQGKSLHRISIEYPLQSGDPISPTPSVATDLYFDPTTHLLLYSVDVVMLSEAHNQAFTRITGYSSYQVLSGIVVPTSIQQSINGQLQWTLSIAQLTLNTNPPASTFSF